MIRWSFFRLLCAGGLVVLGFFTSTPNQFGEPNAFGVLLAIVGLGWGLIELFILSALLLTYGLSGFIHDLDEINRHDPWHRW